MTETRRSRGNEAVFPSNLAWGEEAEADWAAAQGREGAEKVAGQAWLWLEMLSSANCFDDRTEEYSVAVVGWMV